MAFILLSLVLGTPLTASNVGINNSLLHFTIVDDKIVFNANIVGGGSNSSFLVYGNIGENKFLSTDLRFYVISNIIEFFLSTSRIKIKNVDLSIRRYSEYNMYKLNGSLEMIVDNRVLNLLARFNVFVSGNISEKIRVKGAIIPESGDQKLNILALSLLDDLLKNFFDRVEKLSAGLVELREINIERIPTIKGIGARVEVVLYVNNPRVAWKNIIGNILEPGILDYLELAFDNRIKDYVLNLRITIDSDEGIHGRISMLFNESFSELLGLSHTRLSSEALLTLYGSPNITVFNVTGMILEPRDSLKESLHETGLFLYRLIGEHAIRVIVESKGTSLDAKNIPIKPVLVNKTTIIWDKSTVLLYLDRLIVLGKNTNISYLLILILIALTASVLFYIVRRVSWK